MKRVFLFFACALISLYLFSCSSYGGGSAEDILYKICDELELPSGGTYLASAEEGSERYFSDGLIEVLYGKDAKEECFSLIEDHAVYLSGFAAPYEVAVFKCFSRSDTDTVASMCLERADMLAVVLRDTDFASLSQNAIVQIRGRFVIRVVADDPEIAKDIVMKAMR